MNREVKNWMLLLMLSVTWGASFILMKRGMYTPAGEAIFSDRQVAGLRIIIAGLVLMPLALTRLKALNSWKNVVLLLITGVIGNFFPAYLFTYAETAIPSGYAGMLNSCTPVFVLLIGFVIFGNKLSKVQVLGVVIGIAGILLLSIAGQDLNGEVKMIYVLAVVLATFFYGISVNTIKYKLGHLKSIEITSLSFLMLLVPGSVSFYQEETMQTLMHNAHALQGLFFISILSIVGTALAVILYNVLIANSTLLFASTVTFLIPVFAMLFGLLSGERVTALQVSSMLIILAGVFVANYVSNYYSGRGENKSI